MDYFPVIFSLLLVVFQGASEAAVLGTEVSTDTRGEGENPQPSPPMRPHRYKRCSCSSLRDKECVYFCHLDIIWVTTPEHVAPYGLGSPARSKRSLNDVLPMKAADHKKRCHCASPKDKKCGTFCQAGKEAKAQDTMAKGWNSRKKGKNCFRLGKICIPRQWVERRKMQRLDAIRNSIKTSFLAAKLKAELSRDENVTHNRTY